MGETIVVECTQTLRGLEYRLPFDAMGFEEWAQLCLDEDVHAWRRFGQHVIVRDASRHAGSEGRRDQVLHHAWQVLWEYDAVEPEWERTRFDFVDAPEDD